jgi:hypothetical protein
MERGNSSPIMESFFDCVSSVFIVSNCASFEACDSLCDSEIVARGDSETECEDSSISRNV